MAWNLPDLPVAGTIATVANWATKVRDSLRYLKGLDGVPTIQSGLIVDNSLGTEYLKIPSLTTTQRDALTPAAGMIIYNSTTTQFQKYENGAWRADMGFNSAHANLSGLTNDDHTQYQKENLLTTAGDIPYATAASTWERLPKGTALQFLRQNAGLTAPEWATAPSSGLSVFGDGTDGDVTIAADTDLARDMFYNNLTVNTTKILQTKGYRIFIKGTLTNNGTIRNNGTAGANAASQSGYALGGAGGTVGSIGASAAGGNAKAVGSSLTSALGGAGGAGGAGDYAGKAAGTVTAPTAAMGGFRALPLAVILKEIETTVVKIGGGSGGGGGGGMGEATDEGGGGGGGGGASAVMIAANIITNTSGVISANGGAGGNGWTAGNNGGGGGGGGGLLVMIYSSLAAGTEQASGGTGGAKAGTGVVGSNGSAGVVIKITNN